MTRFTGLEDPLIERNHIDSPNGATVIAKPQDETDGQAMVPKHRRGVTLKVNTPLCVISGGLVLGLKRPKRRC